MQDDCAGCVSERALIFPGSLQALLLECVSNKRAGKSEISEEDSCAEETSFAVFFPWDVPLSWIAKVLGFACAGMGTLLWCGKDALAGLFVSARSQKYLSHPSGGR